MIEIETILIGDFVMRPEVIHNEVVSGLLVKIKMNSNHIAFDAFIYDSKNRELWMQEAYQSHRETLIAGHAFIAGFVNGYAEIPKETPECFSI